MKSRNGGEEEKGGCDRTEHVGDLRRHSGNTLSLPGWSLHNCLKRICVSVSVSTYICATCTFFILQ